MSTDESISLNGNEYDPEVAVPESPYSGRV